MASYQCDQASPESIFRRKPSVRFLAFTLFRDSPKRPRYAPHGLSVHDYAMFFAHPVKSILLVAVPPSVGGLMPWRCGQSRPIGDFFRAYQIERTINLLSSNVLVSPLVAVNSIAKIIKHLYCCLPRPQCRLPNGEMLLPILGCAISKIQNNENKSHRGHGE
jgi:hypothetical protein